MNVFGSVKEITGRIQQETFLDYCTNHCNQLEFLNTD